MRANVDPVELHLSIDDLQPGNNLRWLTLPPDDRARNQAYQYWRLTSVPPRRSVNVWGIFWENAKSGISNSRPYSGFSTDTYCMSLLIFDESVGNTLACADWPLEKLLPSLSLQVKKKQPPPGSLVNMPFLCLGDIVRAHRVEALRKCPRYLNLWWRRHTDVAFADCDREEAPKGEDLYSIDMHNQDWRPTLQHDTDAKMAQLYNFFRAKLEGETISRYLKTSVELNFEQPEDLVVEVLAIDAYKKDMLVTDWYGDPDTYILWVRAKTPAQTASWLFQRLRKGHWLKLRWVSKDPPADQDTEDSPDAGGDRPDCYVLASQVTRLPSWCHDVKVRRANSKLDRVADVVARFEEERGSNARHTSWRRSASADPPPAAPPQPAPPSDPVPQARAQHLNEQRAARFWSEFYVDEGSLSPILEALRPQAPGDLLLGNFQVEGICGGPPYELSKTPQIEDLMGVRCRNCGSRYDFQTGMRWWRASRGEGEPPWTQRRIEVPFGEVASIPFSTDWQDDVTRKKQDGLEYLLLTKNNVVVEHAGRLQEEDFPLSLKRKQAPTELPCLHTVGFWKFEGHVRIRDSEHVQHVLAISFSESTARLFGESPEEVARNPEARKMVQEKLIGLFKEPRADQQGFHVMSIRRQGSGAGGGDVDAGWILASTAVQWCE